MESISIIQEFAPSLNSGEAATVPFPTIQKQEKQHLFKPDPIEFRYKAVARPALTSWTYALACATPELKGNRHGKIRRAHSSEAAESQGTPPGTDLRRGLRFNVSRREKICYEGKNRGFVICYWSRCFLTSLSQAFSFIYAAHGLPQPSPAEKPPWDRAALFFLSLASLRKLTTARLPQRMSHAGIEVKLAAVRLVRADVCKLDETRVVVGERLGLASRKCVCKMAIEQRIIFSPSAWRISQPARCMFRAALAGTTHQHRETSTEKLLARGELAFARLLPGCLLVKATSFAWRRGAERRKLVQEMKSRGENAFDQ